MVKRAVASVIARASVIMTLVLLTLPGSPGESATGDITEFDVPTAASTPQGITVGPDGALWFTEETGNKIGRISVDGTITEFPIPTPDSLPWGIATGPDGALWFIERGGNKVGRMTTAGVFTEFPIPTPSSFATYITPGPDGAMWFTETGAVKIGRITMDGTITEFQVPGPEDPVAISAGPDGALWFAQESASTSQIGRITTAGVITEFPTPTPDAGPCLIISGPDGALWFTEQRAGKIGRMTTSGVFTAEYRLPTTGSQPKGLTVGPDGLLWFTEKLGHKLGRISLDGSTIEEFPTPTGVSTPAWIVAAPDGRLWFTEETGHKIARVDVSLANPNTIHVLALAFGFVPPSRTVERGVIIQWGFYGAATQQVRDTSGMDLFDSGPRSPGSLYTYTFSTAGTYGYDDPLNPGHSGRIRVRMRAQPTSGSQTTTFTLAWSTAAASSPYVFDVQIARPGQGFVDWKVGETARSATFVPDAGPGTYQFRTRLRDTVKGASSGYSPVRSIIVNPLYFGSSGSRVGS